MLDRLHEVLRPILGHTADVEQLRAAASIEIVAPGTIVRRAGDLSTELFVVDTGILELDFAGEPPQWAVAGATISVAESLLALPSPCTVTAIRHSRMVRLPIRALNEIAGLATETFAIAQLSRPLESSSVHLVSTPPDPLVLAVVVEGVDAEPERAIATMMESAVASLDGARFVRVAAEPNDSTRLLLDELAAHEVGARTVVYFIGATAGERGGRVAAHADRVLLIQPPLTAGDGSAARGVACDGSPRRHTEVVYIASQQQAPGESTRQMRAPAHTKRTHILPELSIARFVLLLTALRDGARSADALREFELFADLTSAELAWVQRTLHWERVDGGALLVQAGAPPDSLYLVRAGRVAAVTLTREGERTLASLGPGAAVGEVAMLSGTPHRASIRAVRDSTVARIDREMVGALMARSLGFARTMARVVARERVSHAVADREPGQRPGRAIAVVPLVTAERAGEFARALADAMRREGSSAIVVDRAFLVQSLGAESGKVRRGDVGDAEVIAWLDLLERQYETVLLVAGTENDPWLRRIVRQGDHIVVVANAPDAPELRPIEQGIVDTPAATALRGNGQETQISGERHLVLLQPAGISEARGTGAWLAERPHHKHHHVRDRSIEDMARLARRLTGRAVALALSGAASRAPAHFGVVRAMADLDLPIDVMSGSSSGAGVAALVSMGFPFEEALSHALSIIRKGSPTWKHFHPPITALTSGKEAGEVLQAVYGERLLEDQLIPTLITAADIRQHRLVLLTRGPIWKLVRASGSLPLLWPPVWHDEDLLVDGAILSYLPLDVFGNEVESGLTIGSNLEITSAKSGVPFERSLRYGTHVSGWRSLTRRLLGTKGARPPAVVEVLYHAMAIPSFQQQDRLTALAARDNVHVLTPPLKSYGLFGATPEIGKSLEQETWAHARQELDAVAQRWRAGRGG